MTDLLCLENVSKAFGGLLAVNKVSMSIKEGQIFGLIGPNGAGKTTLFNTITGLSPATEGKILLNGENITGLSETKLVLHGICRTFQKLKIFRGLTVLDNVMIGGHIQGKASAMDALLQSKKTRAEENKLREHAMYYIELLGLIDKKDQLAKNLSYGDQRRVEIARALAAEPTLLLLDEPAAGMNLSEARMLTELIVWIRDKLKKTILLIEHNMRVVMPIADWVAVLSQGKKIADGTPYEVQKSEEVIIAYLGRSYVEMIKRRSKDA